MKALIPAPPPKDPPPPQVINIYRAFYGDLDVIKAFLEGRPEAKSPIPPIYQLPPKIAPAPTSGWLQAPEIPEIKDDERACSATQSMRSYCQGKQDCWTVTDALRRLPKYLCGYDPAPYAAPISKGLIVVYECRDKTKLKLSEDSPEPDADDRRYTRFRLGETARITRSAPRHALHPLY